MLERQLWRRKAIDEHLKNLNNSVSLGEKFIVMTIKVFKPDKATQSITWPNILLPILKAP